MQNANPARKRPDPVQEKHGRGLWLPSYLGSKRKRGEAEICRRYCHFKELLLLLKFGMKTARKRWKQRRGRGQKRDRQVAFYSLRRCGQAVTNHRFPFRYSRHFIGRARSPRTKSSTALRQQLTSVLGRTHVSLNTEEVSKSCRKCCRVGLLSCS